MTQLSTSKARIVLIKMFLFSIMGLPRSNASLSGSSMMRFHRVSTLTVWLTSLSCWTSLKTKRFYLRSASERTADAWNNCATCSSWSILRRLEGGYESSSAVAGGFWGEARVLIPYLWGEVISSFLTTFDTLFFGLTGGFSSFMPPFLAAMRSDLVVLGGPRLSPLLSSSSEDDSSSSSGSSLISLVLSWKILMFKSDAATSMSLYSTDLLSLNLAWAVAKRIMVSRVRTVIGTETLLWS